MLLRPGDGDGETVTDRPGRTIRILLEHEWLDVTWTRYEPGQRGPDPHVHREHVDSFFVLAGELVFGLGPQVEEVRAPAGTFVSVPRNVVHTFANAGDAPAFFLNFHAPSCGFAESLRGRAEGFDSFDPPEDGGRPASDAIVSPPGAGERFVRTDRVNVIKTAFPEISAFQLSVDPEWPGVGVHEHDDQVDVFFLLEGESQLLTGDDAIPARPGAFWAAPPGARHGVGSPGGGAVFLNVHAPDAGFADGVRGV